MSLISKAIIYLSPVLWLLGLLLPMYYVFFIKNIKRIVRPLEKRDSYLWLVLLFIGVQLLSVALSVLQDYFEIDRLAAISHNLVAFSFLPLGYSLACDDSARADIVSTLSGLFLFISILSIGAFAFSMTTSQYLNYPGIIKLVSGVDSDFTQVLINQPGWVANAEFPRSRVMAMFPNGSAILMLILYVLLFYHSRFGLLKKIVFGSLFVLATFTTGSRNGVFIAMVVFLAQLIDNKRLLFFLLFMVPLIVIGTFMAIEFLSDLRKDSNDTRLELYWDSIRFSFERNPILGLGLKPKVDQIAEGSLPIGSHSTLLGYFIKNGIMGGIIALFFYTYLIAKAGMRLWTLILTKMTYSVQKLVLNVGVIAILTSLLFDDLDAFEVVPFYFGFLLWSFKNEN